MQIAGEGEMPMSVLLSYQELSDLFMMIASVLVAVLYVIMGATLDMKVLKMIAKKPIGPLVGIVCQYLFMPLVSGLLFVLCCVVCCVHCCCFVSC